MTASVLIFMPILEWLAYVIVVILHLLVSMLLFRKVVYGYDQMLQACVAI